jgi:hypothetical protein
MNIFNLPADKEWGTDNDNEARAFLSKHGLLHKLEPPGAEQGLLPMQTRRLEIWNHPTHWITVLRFFNFPRQADNGYIVRCLPKSHLGRAAFEKQVTAEVKEMFPEGRAEQTDNGPTTGTN